MRDWLHFYNEKRQVPVKCQNQGRFLLPVWMVSYYQKRQGRLKLFMSSALKE